MRRALALALLLGCEPPDDGPAPEPPKDLKPMTTKSGVEMLLIPAGEFRMGSETGKDDEKPTRMVKVEAFYMDRTEVTQGELDRLKVPNPSKFKGASNPVELMPWTKAALFCNTRSKAEGLQPCYDEETAACDRTKSGYRLPTEAEWEYACRAGSGKDYTYGSDPKRLKDHAWYGANAEKRTHPVATKRPNAFGLHDMHGNVAEWCDDVYAKDAYAKGGPPADGERYVLRGGSWASNEERLRCAARGAENPGFTDACLAPDTMGFRCVRNAAPGK
ncbi:MAG TPA: SUMF1/EgtB/PvdO family nonheme iron enzyme [Planctomycetota bacterium]